MTTERSSLGAFTDPEGEGQHGEAQYHGLMESASLFPALLVVCPKCDARFGEACKSTRFGGLHASRLGAYFRWKAE